MGLPVESVSKNYKKLLLIPNAAHHWETKDSNGLLTRTKGGTLGDRLLSATTADADAVDNVALLGLVSETAGLVRARRSRGAVDDIQLTVLYYALSANVQRVYSTDRAQRMPKNLLSLFVDWHCLRSSIIVECFILAHLLLR